MLERIFELYPNGSGVVCQAGKENILIRNACVARNRERLKLAEAKYVGRKHLFGEVSTIFLMKGSSHSRQS